MSLRLLRLLAAGESEDRRKEVEQLDQFAAPLPGVPCPLGTANDERDVQQAFVERFGLGEKAFFPGVVTVIGREDDPGVFENSAAIEIGEQRA